MTSKRTKTKVPYTAAQMYDLVADVEKYPDFLPWCIALRVLKREETETGGTLYAEMVVAYKVFREKFRSSVTFDRKNNVIEAEYLNGPFRNLYNRWQFTDLPEGGSEVDFEIDFEFRSILLQATAQAVFDKAFARMSEAFVNRADEVYG